MHYKAFHDMRGRGFRFSVYIKNNITNVHGGTITGPVLTLQLRLIFSYCLFTAEIRGFMRLWKMKHNDARQLLWPSELTHVPETRRHET